MHYAIWNREKGWPADTDAYVFLARAVQRVGLAMHGAEWLGSEMKVRRKGTPLRGGDEVTILFIPARFNRLRHSLPSMSPPITDEAAALQRVETVYRAIVAACQSGKLESAARPRIGGKIQRLPKSVWNTERWWSRFDTCEIDVERPFDHPFARDRGSWIFVTSTSLSDFLLSLPKQPQCEQELPHLSPYLRLMLIVAKRLDITPQHQPLKKAVVTELRSQWTGDSPLSDSLVEAMGTILREPESKLGRAKRR
jgi:hypothetical protein